MIRDSFVIAHVARHCHQSALLGASYTPGNCASARNLNDKVHSLAAVQTYSLLIPLVDLGVVDGLEGRLRGVRCYEGLQESLRPVQLGLGGRRQDDLGSGDQGNLRCQCCSYTRVTHLCGAK